MKGMLFCCHVRICYDVRCDYAVMLSMMDDAYVREVNRRSLAGEVRGISGAHMTPTRRPSEGLNC
jgi:hypothetical protein